MSRTLFATLLVVITTASGTPRAADMVIDVYDLALRTARSAGVPPGAQFDTVTIVQLASYDAANAIAKRYRPFREQANPPPNADMQAAALGAACGALSMLHPAQQANTATACEGMVSKLSAVGVKEGYAYGETVGKASVQARRAESVAKPNTYRPQTSPGKYVATSLPIGFESTYATPYAMTTPSQFRPGPPPVLTSEVWIRDYNEVKTLGARASAARTPAQTETALFWASGGPQQYLDSVPGLPFKGGDIVDRARLLALLFIAMSDASIAVFDAKYAYDFWRPITAIRNGDEDGNPATERDAVWVPLIETPLHPEYPCAHCAAAAAGVAVLAAAVAEGRLEAAVPLRPAQSASGQKPRSWARMSDMNDEVANARVWSGVHYRNSSEVGVQLGTRVGQHAITTKLLPR